MKLLHAIYFFTLDSSVPASVSFTKRILSFTLRYFPNNLFRDKATVFGRLNNASERTVAFFRQRSGYTSIVSVLSPRTSCHYTIGRNGSADADALRGIYARETVASVFSLLC